MYVSARRRPRWSGRRNVIRRPCPWRQLAACEYRGLASAPHHNVGRILWLTQQENFASVSSTAHRSGFSTPKLRKLHSKRSVKRSRGYAGGWEAEPSGKCGKCICYLGSWHRDCHHLRRPAFPRSDANRELHDSVIFGFILSRNNAQLLMLAAIKVFPVCAGTIDRSSVNSSFMRVLYSYSPSNSHHLSHQSTKKPIKYSSSSSRLLFVDHKKITS